ncbi:hypothetical protein DXG03_007507 [Asterophora parasitica]|uniref:Protein kinase domain-containing protein n=1 Tax=Asterophora parasitica TaxID=117018 RepID=A0A9P7KEI9_9AGAR|nr:hypothetical protein DXG03_007507 [Asterophora parasitica]
MRGYTLRARYQPNWTPSWLKSKKKVTDDIFNPSYEDALRLPRAYVMIDATRQRDGKKVVIKCVPTATEELPIIQYLASPELMADPTNQTVPLLDMMLLPHDDTEVLIVMPQLLNFDALPFRRVGEIYEAIQQYLQKIKWRERWTVRPVPYQFVDFGISRRYPRGQLDVKDDTRFGQDKTVPEYRLPGPYNPFKADIYQLGNAFKKAIEKYDPDGLEELLALCKEMTSPNADDRPSAKAALQILEAMDRRTLNRRIWNRRVTPIDKFQILHCWSTPLV